MLFLGAIHLCGAVNAMRPAQISVTSMLRPRRICLPWERGGRACCARIHRLYSQNPEGSVSALGVEIRAQQGLSGPPRPPIAAFPGSAWEDYGAGSFERN